MSLLTFARRFPVDERRREQDDEVRSTERCGPRQLFRSLRIIKWKNKEYGELSDRHISCADMK